MSPEDVKPEWAREVAEALAVARYGDSTVEQDPEVIEVFDDEARRVLAAVLPEYGAQVLEGVRGLVDAGSWLLLAERAAHLREGGPS